MSYYIAQAVLRGKTPEGNNWECSAPVHKDSTTIFNDLAKNSTVGGDKFNIYQLGIQTMPGVKFTVNDNSTGGYVYVGQTGIFELNLMDPNSYYNGAVPIQGITFGNLMDISKGSSDQFYCIIDVIYSYEDSEVNA